MERERTIFLVEAEVKRHEAMAGLGGWFSKDHTEVAAALCEVLTVYRRNQEGFREHNVRPAYPGRKGGRRR